MAKIASRLFNYIPDQCLVLTGEEYLRPLGSLGNWQRIRIGMLVSVQNYTGGTLNGAGLFLGLVSGRTNTMSSPVCNNAIGVCLASTPALGTNHAWTYNAGAGYPYFSASAAGNFYRRYTNPLGNQVYNVAALGASTYSLPVSGVGIRKRRLPLVLDISYAPNTSVFTFTLYWPADMTSATNTGDYRADHLLDACDQWSTPLVGTNTLWTATTNSTLTIASSTGSFDTLSIFWENQIYPLEVYAVCASVASDAGNPQTAYPGFGGAYDLMAVLGTPIQSGYGTYATPQQSAGTGTIYSGSLATGVGWNSAYYFAGTSNPNAVYGLAGTCCGADDQFSSYAAGTVYSGSLTGGTNWMSGWNVTGGTYSNYWGTVSDALGHYGTFLGPDDPFTSYTAGSAFALAGGTGWGSPYVPVYYAGSTAPMPAASVLLSATNAWFFMGTSSGFPWDNFESYASGTVQTALSKGTGWGSFGTVYSY